MGFLLIREVWEMKLEWFCCFVSEWEMELFWDNRVAHQHAIFVFNCCRGSRDDRVKYGFVVGAFELCVPWLSLCLSLMFPVYVSCLKSIN